MNRIQAPVTKDLVLVGGGHSHVGVLKGFGSKPMPGVRLTLITRDVHTPYSGMLPGLIAGHYEFDETHIDLGPLSQFSGARLYHDEVIGLDLDSKRILCRSRPPVPYDLVSINIGSTPTLDPVPGATESVVPVKPIGNFLSRWAEVRQRVLARATRTRIGVVGAGAAASNFCCRSGMRWKTCGAYRAALARLRNFISSSLPKPFSPPTIVGSGPSFKGCSNGAVSAFTPD